MHRKPSCLTRKHESLKKTFILTLLFSLFFTLFIPTFAGEFYGKSEIQPYGSVLASSQTIWVPENYTRIQWAINNASQGDTITVKAGTYNESVVVNKTVSILGENRDTTIIDSKGTLFEVRADGVIISGFTLQNGYAGVWLYNAKNCTVSKNNIKNTAYGIKLDYAENSKIIDNNINNNQWFSIVLDHSGNSTLQRNSIVGNRYNLRVDGDSLSDFINTIDTSNSVNGKPVYYLINQRDRTIDSFTFPKIGYIAFVNSTNITVKNLDLTQSGQGILFAHTKNSRISNLTTTSNWNGIEINAGSNITVIGNNANNNFDFGMKFEHSGDSVVTQNNANNNGWAGIGIFTSQNVVVNANTVANNINYGIDLVYTTNSIVSRNTVTNGLGAYSMVLYYSNFNLIYHNNFVNYFIYKPVKITNTWDNGLEGNYWSRYNGTDADQDGIGDTSYTMEEGNQDNYPLMGKFTVLNAATENEITVISNSTISNFQFDQQNKIIDFSAKGANGTLGFSRLRIPKLLVSSSYTILIDGQKPLTLKELPISNDTYSYVYLTYFHSASETTRPESVIVPILIVLSIVAIIGLNVIVLLNKRRASKEAAPSEPALPSPDKTETQFFNNCSFVSRGQ